MVSKVHVCGTLRCKVSKQKTIKPTQRGDGVIRHADADWDVMGLRNEWSRAHYLEKYRCNENRHNYTGCLIVHSLPFPYHLYQAGSIMLVFCVELSDCKSSYPLSWSKINTTAAMSWWLVQMSNWAKRPHAKVTEWRRADLVSGLVDQRRNFGACRKWSTCSLRAVLGAGKG